MEVTNPINFLNWCQEIVNKLESFSSYRDELVLCSELQSFIDEFNNWLRSNYVDAIYQHNKIDSAESIDISNVYFQRYCELIYLDATHLINPIRWLFVSEIDLLDAHLMVADIQYQQKKELEKNVKDNNDPF